LGHFNKHLACGALLIGGETETRGENKISLPGDGVDGGWGRAVVVGGGGGRAAAAALARKKKAATAQPPGGEREQRTRV
jgi:hypothetical protein